MSNPKAQAKYHAKRHEAERKLKNIERLLEAHRADAGNKLNYGHVGDLAYVNEQLDVITAFLGQ